METVKNTWGGKREGAGRKATGLTIKNITLTLPIPEAEGLEWIAERENMSVSKYISKHLYLAEIAGACAYAKSKMQEKELEEQNGKTI